MRRSNRFVSDGPARYFAVHYPEIEAAVAAEFAERLAHASWLKRRYLRRLIRREIRRRINAAVSELAQY